MNQSSLSYEYLKPTTDPNARAVKKALALAAGMSFLSLISGCSNVSSLTEERVARSETIVRNAQQAIGQAESGAIELQKAKENLIAAREALAKGENQQAEHWAQRAQLRAELAQAQVQSAQAQGAANDVRVSVETLRQELQRPIPVLR